MIRYSIALALIAGPVAALELALPLDCEIGARCYIQNYVDRDAGPGETDYACGSLTYNGHKGTDFRVATTADMNKGVTIAAAAAGRVRAIRDGVADLGAEYAPDGKECGNGVVVTHEGGWETQYCHLKEGTVSVRKGDFVGAGDRLGLMGYSGSAEFPHLHFSVRKDGRPVDPFGVGEMTGSCDLRDEALLWAPAAQKQLAYRRGGIVDLGLTNDLPTLTRIRAGYPANNATSDGSAMILWARFYGLRKGDNLSLVLIDPNRNVVSKQLYKMPKHRAEELRYTGRKGAKWPSGDYFAVVRIMREGKVYNVATGRYVVP